MSIFEAVGIAWVIFTSAIATVGIVFLAWLGLKNLIKDQDFGISRIPASVKGMFKTAR